MDLQELNISVSLNKTRIEKIGYKSNLCDYPQNNIILLNKIIKQIAININCLIVRYDRLTIDEIVIQLRKNCIKGFEKDFANNTRNIDAIINFIEKNKRKEAKAKLLYIHNQIWKYINSNRHNLTT